MRSQTGDAAKTGELAADIRRQGFPRRAGKDDRALAELGRRKVDASEQFSQDEG